MAMQQRQQEYEAFTVNCSDKVLNQVLADAKLRKDFESLERLSPSPTNSLPPFLRLERACQLGRDIQNTSRKEFPPYTNVAKFIRRWIVQTAIQTRPEPLPSVEQRVAEAEDYPHDYRNVFLRKDLKYAKQRKKAVESVLHARRNALKHLLSDWHLQKLKNQITQKTSDTLKKELADAVKSRYEFLVDKYFSNIIASSSAPNTPQIYPHSAPVSYTPSSASAGRSAATTPAVTPQVNSHLSPFDSAITPAEMGGLVDVVPPFLVPNSVHDFPVELGTTLYEYLKAKCHNDLTRIETMLSILPSENNLRIVAVCRAGTGVEFENIRRTIRRWVIDVTLEPVNFMQIADSVAARNTIDPENMPLRPNNEETELWLAGSMSSALQDIERRYKVAQALLKSSDMVELDDLIKLKQELLKERAHREVQDRWLQEVASMRSVRSSNNSSTWRSYLNF